MKINYVKNSILQPRRLLVVLTMCVCVSVFALQSKSMSADNKDQQSKVEQLQKENKEMQEQLEKLEKDVALYREDIRSKIVEVDDKLDHWLAFLGILMTILGVAIPLILNSRSENLVQQMLSDVKESAKTATEQAQIATEKAIEAAQQAVKASEEASAATDQAQIASRQATSATEKASAADKKASAAYEHTTMVFEHITNKLSDEDEIALVNNDKAANDDDKKVANESSDDDKANKYFSLARSEKDPNKAIELYNKAIENRSNFPEAYHNRGYLKGKLGQNSEAIKDLDKAIELGSENVK